MQRPNGKTSHSFRSYISCSLQIAITVFGSVILPVSFVKAGEPGETPHSGHADNEELDSNRKWPYYSPDEGFRLWESEDGEQRLNLRGHVLARYAVWDWFEGPSRDNGYAYSFQRTRLTLKYASEWLVGFVQPQYVHMYNVPDDAFKGPPEGPLGMGGLYYKHSKDTAPHGVGFHQAYLALRSPGLHNYSIKAGRFEYSDGLEVLQRADGKHFNGLKKMRVADRLISPFGWSAFGRSFDGVMAQLDRPKANLTASFFYPTQGGWENNISTTMDNIDITTLTLTAKRGSFIPGMEIAGFYYKYRDDRDVTQRVDNTPLSLAPAPDGVDIDISMIGGHALGVYDLGPGKLDLLLWGGKQFGDWYELDHDAYAVSAEMGYQFVDVFAKPWFRAGYYIGSGDGDPGDGDHETFFQMAPGTRKYNLLPYCDLMNIEDTFVQMITYPIKNMTLRADYHVLSLNNDDDRWYMGSGPTQNDGGIFGYIGRPSHGDSQLAQELDFIMQYKLNPHWSVAGSYSHIFGGDIVDGVYTKDNDADYFSVELQLVF